MPVAAEPPVSPLLTLSMMACKKAEMLVRSSGVEKLILPTAVKAQSASYYTLAQTPFTHLLAPLHCGLLASRLHPATL